MLSHEIGVPCSEKTDLADFVLSRFRKEEQADLEIGLEKAYKAVESMIKENIDMAMNKYNG